MRGRMVGLSPARGSSDGHGEVTEWPNVAVLKTAVRLAHRGFESLPLRGLPAGTSAR